MFLSWWIGIRDIYICATVHQVSQALKKVGKCFKKEKKEKVSIGRA